MTTPPPTPERPPADRRLPALRRALYPALLVSATALLIAPIWVGIAPGLTDFGGHLAMADIYARLEEVPRYAATYARREGWLPNMLAIRLAGALYPLMSPLTSLRVFVSLSLLATVGGLAATLHAFGRSRWLIFLALPALWNGMLGLGLINYVAALPTLLFGVALARAYAEQGRRRDLVALGIVGIVAYFAHGIGCAFFLGLSVGVLVLSSLARPRRLVGLVALAPCGLLFARWYQTLVSSGAAARATGTRLDSMSWRPPLETLHWMIRQAHDIVVSGVDTIAYLALFIAWVVLLATGRAPERPPAPEGGQAPGGRLATFAHGARTHTLLIVALGLVAALFVLPAYFHGVGISSRLATPALWFLMMIPRGTPEGLGRVAIAAGVGVTLFFGVHLVGAMQEFDRTEMQPLVELVDQLPEESRVTCVATCDHSASAVFLRRPTCSLCPGLAHARRGADAGGVFASTTVNAVKFQEGHSAPRLPRAWAQAANPATLDYVIVRDPRSAERMGRVERVAERPPVTTGSGHWTLYRVLGGAPRGP